MNSKRLTWLFVFDDFGREQALKMWFAVNGTFVTLVRVDIQLFPALLTLETVLVPNRTLRFDLFHLKNGLVACPTVAAVHLGALKTGKQSENFSDDNTTTYIELILRLRRIVRTEVQHVLFLQRIEFVEARLLQNSTQANQQYRARINWET